MAFKPFFLSTDRNFSTNDIIQWNLSMYFDSRMKNSLNLLRFPQWLLMSTWSTMLRRPQPDTIEGLKWSIMSVNRYSRHLYLTCARSVVEEGGRGMFLPIHPPTYQLSSMKSICLPGEELKNHWLKENTYWPNIWHENLISLVNSTSAKQKRKNKIQKVVLESIVIKKIKQKTIKKTLHLSFSQPIQTIRLVHSCFFRL